MSSMSAADWRAKLVGQLKDAGFFRSAAIEAAFRTVPRENFLPADVPLDKVYTDDAIVVKWNEQKQATSSSSQPSLMIDMLEVLRLEPGMRVLEIGAGVGYNAALMAQIVGDGSLITTIDIDPAMAEFALANLQRLGSPYSEVNVLARDGFLGWDENAPYDRIIITVQQWEISPSWVEQLRVGGLIELPLSLSARVRGGLIPVLRKDNDGILRAIDASTGFFMPMRGSIAHPLNALGITPAQWQPVKTNFQPSQLLPPERLTELKKQVGETVFKEAAFYFDGSELSPDLLALLQKQPPEPLTTNGYLEQTLPDYAPTLTWLNMTPAQRHAYQMLFGFRMLLAALLGDQLVTLAFGIPVDLTGAHPDDARANEEWITPGDGRRYQRFCMAYLAMLPDDQALDIALLIDSPSAQGWRLGHAANPHNAALEKVADAWHKWQAMGQPRSSDYRPLAFPTNQEPPLSGVVIARQHYNFLLPEASN